MAGLVVALAPYEKVLVGGALMQNGPKKASLRVLDGAWVLRLTDAMHPDDAATPLSRCYYAAQLLLIGAGGDAATLRRLLADARDALEGLPAARALDEAAGAAASGAWYRLMRKLRPLLPMEAALLRGAAADEPLPVLPAAMLAAIPREPLTARKP